MCITKTVYYSTCCPLYEQENYIGSDVLVEVRRNFLKQVQSKKIRFHKSVTKKFSIILIC